MIRQHRHNSTQQAAKDNRLATIAIAAQKAAYKRSGGTVESLGVTPSKTLGLKRQHDLAVMPIQGGKNDRD